MMRRQRSASAASPAPRRPLLTLPLLLLLAAATTAQALVSNPLTAWTDAAQETVRSNSLPNFVGTRAFALVGLASLRAIEQNPSLDPAAAAALASHAVLSALFPWAQSNVYDGLLRLQLPSPPPKRTRDQIRALANDLVEKKPLPNAWDADFEFAPAGTLWRYQKAPMQNFTFMPQQGQGVPIIASASRLEAIAANTDARRGPVFRPPTPLTIDYETTYAKGGVNSTARTPYDAGSAMFWVLGSRTSGISGQWLSISWSVLPGDLTIKDTALFLARAFGAAYDATIVTYKLKYSVLQWRPISAFNVGYPQQANVPARKPDPSWRSLLPMTPAHPEYPSGHASTASAIAEVLLRTLGGKDDVTFTTRSEGAPDVGERTYRSLTAAAAEVGDSRVFGGVHFNASCVDALRLGRLVGKEAFESLGGGGGGGWARRFFNPAAAAAASGR